MRRGFGIHSELDERWVPVRRRANDYLIDRADQKTRSFTGIRGISEQDARTLIATTGLAEFAEAAVALGAPARDAAMWVRTERRSRAPSCAPG